MEKLSRVALAHKRLVTVLVALSLLAGGGAFALLFPNVSEQNAYPGLPGYEANQEIMSTYGNGGYERPFVPVVTLPEGQTADGPPATAVLERAFAAVADETDARVVSFASTGDERFIGAAGTTSFGLVFPGPVEQGGIPGSALGETPDLTPLIVQAMEKELPADWSVHVTGLDTLATGENIGGLNVPIKLLLTIIAALAVLLWIFRSALAFVPLLTAVVALPVSFVGLLLVSQFITVHETTLMMTPLFGLGIAIDYALIVVSRWREELARGNHGDDAVHRAMATAGQAVLFSSGAVAIGLTTMVVLPIPLLRSLGAGAMTVTAASAVVSLTVLPLLLSRSGRRRALQPAAPGMSRDALPSRRWTMWARGVIRFRWLTAFVTGGVLMALTIIALGINLSLPTTDNLVDSGPGRDGLTALTASGIPAGTLTAFDVYVPPGTDAATVARDIAALPGIHTVAAPDDDSWRRDGSALITVLPVDEAGTPEGEATITRVVNSVPDGVMVGGNATQQMDYVDVTYSAFPWMLTILSVITFLLLARAFRSILLPLKAILLNLLSLGAVLGAMVIFWQWGWGTEAVLGIQPDGAIGTFVPVTIFAFLFGLTMDYEVFILARMREEYDRTGSTNEAIVQGIGRTGRLVTSAALILFFSFGAMATGGELDVAIFASGIALGLLIDATLIRALLVPAVIAMMGKWNWWLPDWAARVLRVRPAPRNERTSPAPTPELMGTSDG